jgi:hypothetical protein
LISREWKGLKWIFVALYNMSIKGPHQFYIDDLFSFM